MTSDTANISQAYKKKTIFELYVSQNFPVYRLIKYYQAFVTGNNIKRKENNLHLSKDIMQMEVIRKLILHACIIKLYS